MEQWSGKIKMSKRGSVALRTALFQAASMARLHEPSLAEICTAIDIKCINITA
jgi:transposase